MRFIDGVGYVDIPDEKNDWYDVPSDEMTLEQARQAVKDLRKKLTEHLEQEQKSGKWIPCSERLPEDSGTYLVTVHDGRKKRTTFAQYQKKLKNWVMTGARAYWCVKAWMPLPEPYKGE